MSISSEDTTVDIWTNQALRTVLLLAAIQTNTPIATSILVDGLGPTPVPTPS